MLIIPPSGVEFTRLLAFAQLDADASVSVWIVGLAALITAICTGLGVIPFLFLKSFGRSFLGISNAAAAGLMAAASLGLLVEGFSDSVPLCAFGIVAGCVILWGAQTLVPDDESIWFPADASEGEKSRISARRVFLFVFVMTVHSFAEGIGVGVSFAGREGFGQFISTAIAIHNIPEGLAIGLLVIPRGTPVWQAGLWSVFSSLPQPLMAIPAFLFVIQFRLLLPVGLGLAAGAMVGLVVTDLLPEAAKNTSRSRLVSSFAVAFGLMWLFQWMIS